MQKLETKKKDIVNFFLKKGMLVSQDILEHLEDKKNLAEVHKLVETNYAKDISVLNKKIKYLFEQIVKDELENTNEKKTPDSESNVKVVYSYNGTAKKREANDFIQYFNNRFRTLQQILKQRPELHNRLSINRLANKKDREQISVIGMVRDKQQTKNGNYMLTIEDNTGSIRIIITKNKPKLFKVAQDIVLDEVIGITGANGDNIIFVNNISFPDIPLDREIKKAKEESYALFLSDIHVGSKNFLKEDFNRFLKWINCDLGNEEQRQIASRVKYIFVLGDLVDGCGIYPNQEKELEIKDIKEQYEECANLLSKIPSDIKLIICPGNHDAMRVAEPQLPIYRDFAESLYNLPNATMVSNPSIINIHSSAGFSGFDVLLYHGYSFDFYVSEVASIRNNGGYDRVDLIMKLFLQKRNLAPSHTSTLYVPDTELDNLAINKVPDFFVSGHIHKAVAANYRNVTLISGSCWQSKTTFQEKVGHNPEPSRVPIVNLQTRHVKMLKLGN
jgi:DNA polymerase II small subunit